MRVCVSASADTLEAPVDPRFGRCHYFIIVNTENMSFEAIPNMASETIGGAGIQAAQLIVSKGVKAIITGNIGPNALQALLSAEVKVYVGASGTVREAIEKYMRGELREVGASMASGYFGMNIGWQRDFGRR